MVVVLSLRKCVPAVVALGLGSLGLGSLAFGATFTVNSTADSGAGSLRQAILDANGAGGADSIVFSGVAASSTITLASPLPMISEGVTINGAGAAGLTVSGASSHRVFFAQTGAVTIQNLTIADGRADGGAGGAGRRGAGGGALGAGGALFVNSGASVTLENVALQGNSAVGGTGGSGSAGHNNAMGGGGGLGGDGGGGGNGVGGGGGGYLGNGGTGGNSGAAGGGGLVGIGGNGGNLGGGGGGGTTTAGTAGGNVTGSPGGAANGGRGGDAGDFFASINGQAGTAGGLGGGGGGGGAGTPGFDPSDPGGDGGNGGTGGWGGGGGGGASGGPSATPGAGGDGGAGGPGGDFGGGGGGAFGSGSNNDGAGGGGGYGGGGGGVMSGNAGDGGFGGGGGGGFSSSGTVGSGGFAAGGGTNNSNGDGSGGGGGALGGAVFVRDGGSITLRNTSVSGSAVTAGAGGGTGAGSGQALGTDLFLHNATVTYDVTGSQTLTLDGVAGIGANDPRNPTSAGGSLVKTGAGTLMLSGASTYGGATTVSAGRLAVNGSLLTPVTVDAGGTLGGAGSVGAITVNGTIAAGNSIGQITSTGPYVQNTGSTMVVEINSVGTTPGVNNDHVNVVGNSATIGGGTLSVLAAPGSYTDGTVYTILSASGGVTGAGFDAVIDDLTGFDVVWGFFGNDLRFTLQSVFTGTNFAATARTPNERAIAMAIDGASLGATGAWDNAIDDLSLVTGSARWQALNQFGFELLGTQAVISVQQTGLAAQGLSQQLAMLDAPCCPCSGGLATEQWVGWTSGFGLGGATQGDGNASATDYSYGGTSFGAAKTYGGVGAVGLFGNYAQSQLAAGTLGQSIEMDHLLLGGFVRWNDSVGYWLAAGAGGVDDFDTRRSVAVGGPTSMTGDGSGSRALVYLERGLDFGSCASRLQPYAGLQYTFVQQDEFTESGPLALSLGTVEYNSLQTVLGARWDAHRRTAGGRVWNPGFQAAWRHELLDSTAAAPFSLDGATATVVGADLGRDWAQLGPRVALQWSESLRTFAGYDVLLNDQQVFHVGSGGVELLW
ncbi:MAG: autotransporter domain-containing protein [Lacipirellulaceae bacterium]